MIKPHHDDASSPKLSSSIQQNDHLRVFIDHAPLAMAMFDRQMCYIAASRRWREDYGLGDCELIGHSHYEIFPEIDDPWKAIHKRGLSGETIRNDQDRFVRKDGQVHWLRWEVSPWQLENGSTGGIFIFSEDITDRKRIEESLREITESLEREVKARTAELMEAQRLAHVASWTWDSVHDVAWWSPEYFRIAGLAVADQAPPVSEQEKIYTPETFTNLMSVVATLLRTGETYEVPLDVVRPDGSVRYCIARGERMAEREGCIRGTVADVTEMRRLEEEKAEFEASKARIQKIESLGRMAGAVAHHFNNNLTGVLGNLELAMGIVSENHFAREGMSDYLAEAMKSAMKGVEVSRVMLTYLGQRPMKTEHVDLCALCKAGLDLLRAGAPANVVILPRLSGPGPFVQADVAMIQEVLAILLVNAWEATGKDRNIIRVRVSTVEDREIPEKTRNPVNVIPAAGSYACLDVADTGVGIEPECMASIFDPFYSTKFAGRGLGLPSALGIVQMHHGLITFDSKPGKGSSFKVFLPAVV